MFVVADLMRVCVLCMNCREMLYALFFAFLCVCSCVRVKLGLCVLCFVCGILRCVVWYIRCCLCLFVFGCARLLDVVVCLFMMYCVMVYGLIVSFCLLWLCLCVSVWFAF